MRINNVSSHLAFTQLKMKNEYGVRVFEDFDCATKNNHSVQLTDQLVNNEYVVSFFPQNSIKACAEELIVLDPERDYLHVANMFTDVDFEKQGLGKSMHLMNILEMLENDITSIQLNAIPTSIPFHVKMGFKPNGAWKYNVRPNLISVANSSDPEFSQLKLQAKNLLSNKTYYDYEKEILGNRIILKYAEKANEIMPKSELRKLFAEHMPMELYKDDVIERKNFYNELFRQQGIDYEIG